MHRHRWARRAATVWTLVFVVITALVAAPSAAAATWVVGPTGSARTIAEAIRNASDGDVIEVQPGHYPGDVAVIHQRRLTIRGTGARPVVSAAGRHAEGKAIWVIRDGDITIDNIEFRGARVPEFNGAAIRLERGRLQVLRCAFFDNEMGVLTSNDATVELRVVDSEFGQAPTHPGDLHHLIYVGRIRRFEVTGSRFSQGHLAHLIKSRARESIIVNNHIVDGPRGRAAYEIDLPNAGLARIEGNTIGQSATTDNATLVAYGAEGAHWPDNALTMRGNTLISDWAGLAWFVRVWSDRLPSGTRVELRDNRLIGHGALAAGPGAVLEGNVVQTRP